MKINSLYSDRAALFLAAVIALSPGNGFGSESSDDNQDQATQDKLLEYRQSQDILTFEDILKILRTDIEGEIIEIEFEVEGSVPIYEITFIDAAGQVLERFMDAKTGELFEEEPE